MFHRTHNEESPEPSSKKLFVCQYYHDCTYIPRSQNNQDLSNYATPPLNTIFSYRTDHVLLLLHLFPFLRTRLQPFNHTKIIKLEGSLPLVLTVSFLGVILIMIRRSTKEGGDIVLAVH